MHTAKCFTKCRKRFSCEIILKNEHKFPCDKTTLLITESPQNWQPTKLKQDTELALNDSANIRRLRYSGGTASYQTVSLLIHGCSLGCVLIWDTLYKICVLHYLSKMTCFLWVHCVPAKDITLYVFHTLLNSYHLSP
jgi:hypothetical protein